MRLANATAPVEVSGGSATTSFTIAMNGKAFRVLSDTLYQNKIGSIVREVSCNAYDAHVMAGKPDVPFIIHLPDAFEPWFSVQDFGVGLSPSDIKNVFTVYFQSTKDDSNDAVGAFGLGAKTPFSYTDQFTVTTVCNGMRHIYSAYITESGVPDIVEMDASPTTDINGVEIKLSAKREDYSKFASEVASQLKFFAVKPLVKNSNHFSFPVINNNAAIQTDNVFISNDSVGYGNSSWAHIIQGNVGYPLDVHQCNEKLSVANRALLNTLNGTQVRFYFNIGEIGVTASREGVEYNKHTLANIEKKLDAVRVEITDYITKAIDKYKLPWEKAEYINSNSAIAKLARAASIELTGVKRDTSGSYYFDFNDMLVDDNKKDALGRPTIIGTVKKWTSNSSIRQATDARITPSRDKVEIVLRDTGNKPNIRAKHYMGQVGCSLLEIDMYGEAAFDDAFIKTLTSKLGGFNKIKRLSAIEPPERVTIGADGIKVRVNYNRPTSYMYAEGAMDNVRQWTRDFEPLDENEEDAVFVVIKDMALLNASEYQQLSQYNKLLKFSDKVPPLYGIRENDVKKIAGKTNFITLQDFIASAIKRIEDDKKLFIKWKHNVALMDCIASKVHYSLQETDVVKALNDDAPDNVLTKIINRVIKHRDTESDRNKLDRIAEFMGWAATADNAALISKRKSKIGESYGKLMSRYPLIGIYNDWSVRRHVSPEHLAKYLNVM